MSPLLYRPQISLRVGNPRVGVSASWPVTPKPLNRSSPKFAKLSTLGDIYHRAKFHLDRIRGFASVHARLRAPLFTRLFMAALRSRCGHYIFASWFLLSSTFFFPRPFSAAVADWMSTILSHTVWP